MPATQRQQTAKSKSTVQVPTSPTSKPTAKYTNKDGSKFITVPKSDSTQVHVTNMDPPTSAVQNGQVASAPPAIPNKKKQKRREKEAAKRAAEQDRQGLSNGMHGESHETRPGSRHTSGRTIENRQVHSPDADNYYSDEDGDVYSGSYGSPPNGHSNIQPSNAQGSSASQRKKKGKNGRSRSPDDVQSKTNGLYHTAGHHSLPHTRPGSLLSSLPTSMPRGPGISKEKIWNTSSQEERERIKEFWLSLEEGERKSLVKVEKDAVLKKMKEQQRHSCSCTVCGRKRTAIEEELEVLYDAYYEELEQYANHHDGVNQPMMPPPRRFGAIGGLQPPNRLPPSFSGQQPSRGRIVEPPADDEEDDDAEDDYSEDPLDDDYESEPEEIPPRSYQTDFFNFGASLTVQGGILTVADDLLKNDGKKFIEMMEQLAERRMAREEDAKDQNYYNHQHPPNGLHRTHSHTHNHPPPPLEEEEYDEDEDDEEYDSQEDDYDDDEEELDTMTEEQRMEEGRRMFQIFAARMFEQRVLTAYREKVAKERQQKLIEEDEEERKREDQRKAKKAKDAQKKKDKLQQKKQLLAEEKAKREAEEAERLAAKAAAEEKIKEDQRLKDEEKRKKKEAQKAAQEAERVKQLQEKQRLKERQMEEERKKREAKEKKDEQKREERERKEREVSERKAKLEQEKRDKEAKVKSEKEAKDRQQREELAAQQAAAKSAAALYALKRPPVPIPVSIQPQHAAIASPHVPIATPVVPKAPTPSRLRTASQHESSGSSVPQTPQNGGLSQNVSPVPSTPLQGSPGPIGPPGKTHSQQPFLHHPQASSPIHSALKTPPGIGPPPFASSQPLGGLNFPPSLAPLAPPGFNNNRMGAFDPIYHPQMASQYRPLGPTHAMPPPGINIHPMHQGRGFPMPTGPLGYPQSPSGFGGIGPSFVPHKDSMPPQSHSRQASASFDPVHPTQAQPIARPAPIGRPASIVHGQRHGESYKHEVDDLSDALGSSALIDDSDEPLGAGPRRPSGAMNRQFPPPTQPFGLENNAFGIGNSPNTPWGTSSNPFGPPSLPGSNFGGGWPQSTNTSFGTLGSNPIRTTQPRSVAVRLMICRACKEVESSTRDGYCDINDIKKKIDQMHPPLDPPVTENELMDICGTEGTPSNGGGYLDLRSGPTIHPRIKYEASPTYHIDSAGHIGSPIVGGGRF